MSWLANADYQVPKIPKETIGYLAGLFDGEGCITISKYYGRGSINVSHRLYIKITMGHEKAIRRLRRTLKIGAVTKQPGKHWNSAWTWWASLIPAIRILRVLRPLLHVKAKEADLAFRFAAIQRQRGSSKCVPARVIAARERLFVLMRDAKPSAIYRKI